jgi:DNA-binding LacI/PurR family transcriptional regulator
MSAPKARARRPTISDIARRAGVSISAVSYALNGQPGVSEQTRQRVVGIAQEVGWRPSSAARALTGLRAHAVGLVIARPARTLGVEPFFMQLIAGLEGELSAAKSALLLQLVEDHEQAIEATRTWWAEGRIDGTIVTDLWQDDTRVSTFEQLGIPSVLIGSRARPVSMPSVWVDDTASVHSVVDYLVALGHRRIARVAGLSGLEHTSLRTEAFLEAARDHGLTEIEVVPTDYSWEEGARATRSLLTRRIRPTAITYDNDVMAVAAVGVAGEIGLSVPDDVSIVAGEDSQLNALVHPALTALERDVPTFGAHAARVLLNLIKGEEAESYEDASPRLIVRGSTAQPRPD